ncbi:MAG: tetratricopeptide repeat protein [Spirochaetia bacterium]|nr:tetratricopeptide repeat protein [Spirochaetia bacterium]
MVTSSQPRWYFLTPHSYGNFRHILGVSFGFRTLMADFDYISFLQYYGDKTQKADRYRKLYGYLDDITNADPNFTFAYTYGSAILAFNLERYDEAIKLINKGIEYNPSFWKLHFYLGAIIFKQKGETEKYIGLLEDALKFADHPAIIERLLGNIYETTRAPDFAALYWLKTAGNSKDGDTRGYAYKRLKAIVESGKLSDPEPILRQINGQ